MWPFGVALRGASNRRLLRWLKTVVVSETEKAHVMRQVGIGKTVRSLGLLAGVAGEVSLEGNVTSEPGRLWSASGRARRVPADWPGGVRHVGDVSPVCCSRMERGKACPGTTLRGERERFERMNRKRLSTDPGRAGGLVRSSGEAPAGRGGGGAKGRAPG